MRRSPLTVLAASCLLLLAACGGSDEAAAPTSSVPSVAAEPTGEPESEAPSEAPSSPSAPAAGAGSPVVADMEEVCKTTNAQLDAIPAPDDPADFGSSVAVGVSILDNARTRLEQLAADSPDGPEITTIFLDPLRQQQEVIRAYAEDFDAALAQGSAAVEALPDPDLPAADSEAMQAKGFDACVQLASQ